MLPCGKKCLAGVESCSSLSLLNANVLQKKGIMQNLKHTKAWSAPEECCSHRNKQHFMSLPHTMINCIKMLVFCHIVKDFSRMSHIVTAVVCVRRTRLPAALTQSQYPYFIDSCYDHLLIGWYLLSEVSGLKIRHISLSWVLQGYSRKPRDNRLCRPSR